MMKLTALLVVERRSRHRMALRRTALFDRESGPDRAWYMREGRMFGYAINQTQNQEQEMHHTKKPLPSRPFFARFLEKQALENVGGGGGPVVTLKFPSDNDEDVTLKFPSDNDESGA